MARKKGDDDEEEFAKRFKKVVDEELPDDNDLEGGYTSILERAKKEEKREGNGHG